MTLEDSPRFRRLHAEALASVSELLRGAVENVGKRGYPARRIAVFVVDRRTPVARSFATEIEHFIVVEENLGAAGTTPLLTGALPIDTVFRVVRHHHGARVAEQLFAQPTEMVPSVVVIADHVSVMPLSPKSN